LEYLVRKFFLSSLLVFLTACSQPNDHNAVFYVFGTNVDVTLRGVDDTQASEAFATLQIRFQAMHRDWHAWEPGKLSRINQAFARGGDIEVSDDIATMIRRSQRYEAASGGRFNPAIGGLIELWGFHTSDFPVKGPPPSAHDIQVWLDQHPSSHDIHIVAQRVSSNNPAVKLDFGGIAKGYATDKACTLLKQMGVKSAIVSAGGDLRAYGAGSENPWNIAVSKPGGGVIGSILVSRDESIFTSGSSQRFRENANQRYPHIIDPRDGMPVQGLKAVTVIASDGMLADAAATSLMVAGADDWPAVAAALGIDTVLVVDNKGGLFASRKMLKRLSLQNRQSVTIRQVSLPVSTP